MTDLPEAVMVAATYVRDVAARLRDHAVSSVMDVREFTRGDPVGEATGGTMPAPPEAT